MLFLVTVSLAFERFLSTYADRQGVDIYRLLFVCVCLFVRLRISLLRINLAASNFARRFIGVHGRESPIFVKFAPPRSPKSDELASVATTSTKFTTITFWLPST